jgi:hypothetical protein
LLLVYSVDVRLTSLGYPIGLFQFAPYPDAIGKIAAFLLSNTCIENEALYAATDWLVDELF